MNAIIRLAAALLPLTVTALSLAAPRQIDNEDGMTSPVLLAGRAARAVQPVAGKGRHIYFGIDDSFKASNATAFTLESEYFDGVSGELSLEFDVSDPSAPFSGAYTRAAQVIRMDGLKTWRKARFTLKGARLDNSQNRSADFRLVVAATEIAVSEVRLSREESKH